VADCDQNLSGGVHFSCALGAEAHVSTEKGLTLCIIAMVLFAGIFEMRERYGIATYYSKHPDVNEYIVKAVTGFRKFLMEVRLCFVCGMQPTII